MLSTKINTKNMEIQTAMCTFVVQYSITIAAAVTSAATKMENAYQ